MPVFYADASALVKAILEEEKSKDLRDYFQRGDLVSCELILTEVPRALQRAASEEEGLSLRSLLRQARELIDAIALQPLDSGLLVGAGALDVPSLRSLDAIHLVAAVTLYPIDAFVTYDKRQAAAARLVGLRTVAPGADY
jgi:predicted nucleic acid-binding protein